MAIKAHELRIGNLVFDHLGRVQTVAETRADAYICYLSNGAKLKYKLNTTNPIPLTEEWLLKFGGEKLPHFTVSNSIIIKTKRNQQLSFGCVGNPNFMVFIQEINDDDKITDLIAIHNWDYDGEMYVHQLQNLYFALVGEELKVN